MNDELSPLRAIAPDPERMLAMRRRVLAEIAADAETVWPGRLWAVAALSLAMAVWAFWPRPRTLEFSLPAWTIEPPAFAYRLTPPRRPMPRPRPAKPSVRPVDEPAIEVVGQTEGGVQLRIASSNPDVILYYFLDNPGE
ncbi:MAG: hypothetical protein GC160_02020 [Acidobacteria bacterium]|nr:hypothetical protein [Acidobacteriota bacterium]